MRTIAQGGDGGTTDIGFGCLSGMFERNDDVLYICYDNEGYMNTGVQRSSATPPAARTATTPAIGPEPGNVFGTGKSVPKIAIAHGIPYVATATVADLHDLERKVIKAMGIHGARYIHIHVPCPLGWGSASHDTIRLARLAVESGLFPMFEAEHGVVTASRKIRRQVPVTEYLQAAEALRAPVRIRRRARSASPDCRRSPIATSPNFICSMPEEMHDGTPVRHHARRRHEPRQPHRLVAHLAARSMSTGCRPAIMPVRRARTSRAGCPTPKPATTKPRGACSRRTIRCRRSWGASAITRAKPPAIAPRSTRRSASIRSSASSATRRSSRAGGSRRRRSESGKRVLVVGAGPSGLSAAYHLRRLGHAVEIYEAGPIAGGMMRFGIPKYRLPRDVLDAEIARILDLGVTLQAQHQGR